MTKKLFIAVARIISEQADPAIRRSLAESFAAIFAAENGRFDRDRFFTACGL